MVKRYKGGLMGSTEAVTSSSDARGMWGTVQATQARNTGNWPALLTTETAGSGSGAGFANGFMTVSNVAVTDSNYTVLNDTPNISTAGGYIKITGRGFVSGCVVYVGGTPATSTTFISSTEVRAQIAAATSNTLMVYVVNPDGSTGIKLNSLVFSGTPTWTTGATLTSQVTDVLFSISFAATSDSAVTYVLNTGSTLPPGTSLFANGLFTGTVTGLSSDTTYSFSVLANDAENQDTARTFSVTFGIGDSGFPLTSSIFNSDGNTWVRDASANNAAITVGNDTRPTAFSPYNSNWSGLFNGSTDYLTVPAGTDFAYGTGDFTVEGWFYATSTLAAYGSMLWSQVAAGHNYFLIAAGEGASPVVNNYIQFVGVASGGGSTIYSSTAFTFNSWNHFAVVRISGLVRVYLNGVGGTATSNTTDFNNTSYVPNIGKYTSGTSYFPGYISNLRVVKGVGVYTGNFTPPTTALTATQSSGTNIAAITAGQTVFLGLQTNRFIDNSATPKTITAGGTPQIKSFGSFTETDATTGSAYFDGTGDYLIITDNAGMELGAGDFSFECWIYTTTNSGTGIVIDKRSGGYAPILIWRNLGNLQLYMSGNGSSWSIVNGTTMLAMTTHTWYHIAVYRVGTAVYYAINGVVTSAATSSATPVNNATNWYIGTETNGSTNPWTGWIADMRFVVGSSPYGASTFIPPTSLLTTITGTQFLSLQYRTGENNHRFIDESGNKYVALRGGDTYQGTFSPHSPAGWSAYFDGTGDYLTFPELNISSSTSFTIEFWFYWSASPSTYSMFVSDDNGNSSKYIAYNVTSATLEVQTGGSAGTTAYCSFTPILNTWYHLAFVRNTNTVTIYVNGVAQAMTQATQSGTFLDQGTINYIGRWGGTTPYAVTGYMSNFRAVVGLAVYTGNFTTPTSILGNTQSAGSNIAAITSGSTFLTLQDNRFKDNGTNAFAITRAGDVRIHAFSPFRASGAYSPTLHGGSAYFDGTGDYISSISVNNIQLVPTSTTSTFTVDGWLYPTSLGAQKWIIGDMSPTGASGNNIGVDISASNKIELFWWTGSSQRAISADSVVLNQWNYFAIVVNNNAITIYVNSTTAGQTGTTTLTTRTTVATGWGIGQYSNAEAFAGYMSGIRWSTGIARTISAIPTAPPILDKDTTLLFNFTHAGIIDYTARNNIYTFTGTNIRTSNVQSKFGTGSLFFTGGYQYVFIGPGNNAAHPPLLPTVGDYTVEFWVYATAGDTTLMCLNTTLSVYAACRLQVNANGSVGFLVSTSSPNVINIATGAGSFAYNTWQHIAVVRNGGTHTVYVNGTAGASSTAIAATTAVQGGVESVLGCIDNRNNSDFASFFQGYIDDFRTTRYARYTANFTPPTTTFLTR